MILGIGEIAIIIIVTLALFLPDLSKRSEHKKSSHKFKLYLVIALLVALVLILSRFVFRVLSVLGLLIFFVIIILYAIGKKFVE